MTEQALLVAKHSLIFDSSPFFLKSLADETQQFKTNGTGNKDENLHDMTENTRGCLNDGDVKEVTTLSDQPVVQDMNQNSEKRDEKQMVEQVNQGAFDVQSKDGCEQDNTGTSYQEVKNDGEPIEVERRSEQVKGNDEQDSRACHKVNSNELPSKVEDKSAGSPCEQDVDNALQLVSQSICRCWTDILHIQCVRCCWSLLTIARWNV